MKHLLLTTIAAVVLVGCGPSESDRALLKAAQEGNIKAVKQHLAAGTDVNAKNKHGYTPFHNAALEGYKEVAELLIQNGADVNAKNRIGATPLGWGEYAPQKYPGIRAIFDKHGIKYGKKLKAFKAAGN